MVIFSIIQFVANGWRAVLWWRFVLWRIFFVYVVGAVLSFAVMRYVAIVPSKAVVYLALGLMPFRSSCCRRAARPNIEWRGVPFVTGVLTTVIQLLTGVGGLFLDIFFQKSMLDRKTTIATKAVTQTFSHVVRAVYFGSFVGDRRRGAAVDLRAGDRALDRRHVARRAGARTHDRCRLPQWTRRVIFAVSAIYLVRGVMLLWRRIDDYWLAHMMRAIHSTSSTDSVRSVCSGLSDRSSIVFAVRRLSSFAITSPSLVLTTTRSPRRTGEAGETMMMVPSR